MGVKIKKIIKKVEKKWWKKKWGKKKLGQKKIKKVKKKSAGEKSKQAVVEVASELLFGLVLKCPRNICDWALVWPRSKSPEMA